MLRDAKPPGQLLVVMITNPARPLLAQQARAELVAGLADVAYVDRLIVFERGTLAGLKHAWGELRRERFDLAVDFQGLIKSALVAACARPERLYGFDSKCAREAPAAWFYSRRVHSEAVHRVDKYLDLAVEAGVTNPLKVFPLPPGNPEGRLP